MREKKVTIAKKVWWQGVKRHARKLHITERRGVLGRSQLNRDKKAVRPEQSCRVFWETNLEKKFGARFLGLECLHGMFPLNVFHVGSPLKAPERGKWMAGAT